MQIPVRLVLVAATFALSGCQTTQTGEQPTPQTEWMVSAKSEFVISGLREAFSSENWKTTKISQYEVEAEMPAKNIGVGIMYTCMTCPPPRDMMKVQVINLGNETKIAFSAYWRVNPETPVERMIEQPKSGGWISDAAKVAMNAKARSMEIQKNAVK